MCSENDPSPAQVPGVVAQVLAGKPSFDHDLMSTRSGWGSNQNSSKDWPLSQTSADPPLLSEGLTNQGNRRPAQLEREDGQKLPRRPLRPAAHVAPLPSRRLVHQPHSPTDTVSRYIHDGRDGLGMDSDSVPLTDSRGTIACPQFCLLVTTTGSGTYSVSP